MVESTTAELVYQTQVICGECPVWDEVEQKLYWSDLTNCHLYIFNPHNGSNMGYNVGTPMGALVLREKGGLMLATQKGFGAFDPATGLFEINIHPEAGLPGHFFGDGKCDPRGRFWAGTYHQDISAPVGSLYSLESDLVVKRRSTDLILPNGLAWSVDQKKFYHVDSIARCIYCFDYDADSGDIVNRNVLRKFRDGIELPDGITVDSEGFLWVAIFNGGKVIRIDPLKGETDFEVFVPKARQVTSCAFGGRNLDELYITTAREVGGTYGIPEGELAADTNAGGLFKVKLPFMGISPARFKG